MEKFDPAILDRKGLIRESYRMDGITAGECRSIFLDWALSVPEGADVQAFLTQLIAQYGDAHPDHPMTQTLREGLQTSGPAKRRGGRAAKFKN
ncbi:hypothetical protein [Aestuariibius sp. HNIBRBA575]|uniref:hypothetical protein n=1 Tax=Aestuariibius sp. HNIBRBA575 TaxID=3233343 RepID=UPI0034A331DB